MKIIIRDNFGRERPEKVILENLSLEQANEACVKLNDPLDDRSQIWHVIVEDSYVPLTWEKIYGVQT